MYPRVVSPAEHKMDGPWKGRSRSGHFLILLLVALFICVLALSITVGIRDRKGWRKCGGSSTCDTEECITAASELLTSRDDDLDPCEDFYDYACRKWINATVAMDDNSDHFAALREDTARKLKVLLEEDGDFQSLPEHFQKAKTYYRTCMNMTGRHDAGVIEFLTDLDHFGGYPALRGHAWDDTGFKYLDTLAKMVERGFDNGILIHVGMEPDYKNNSIERILVTQTNLGLPKADYFLREDLMALYTHFVSQQAYYLCQKDAQACPAMDFENLTIELGQAVAVEAAIASMRVPDEVLIKKENNYHIMKVSELQETAPDLDWLSLLKIFFPAVAMTDEIWVTSPGFMLNISKYISELDSTPEGKRKLANYMMYRQSSEISLHTTQRLRHLYYEFQGDMTRETDILELWRECQMLTRSLFDFSLASVFAKKYFPLAKKNMMEELLESIRSEMKLILMVTSWMDETTKQEALNKLDKIYVMAGYPDELLDDSVVNKWYQELAIGSQHFENMKNGHEFLIRKVSSGYGRFTDKRNWKHFPAALMDVNALYHANNNSIMVPLGITQGFFFDENRPKYVNYGRLGMIIGHEFGHAFDTEGADFDEQGNWRNWWKEETKQKFKDSSKCMVDMYSSYHMKEVNMTLNGARTLTENMADDIGFTDVYRAFVRANKKEYDPPLPGLDMNPNQLFWLNLALTWCEKKDASYYEHLISSDPHPPARFRVIGPLSNNLDFIRDFNCKSGTKMNMNLNKCHVWGI